MIGREILDTASFWSFLLSIDRDLADSTRHGAERVSGDHPERSKRYPPPPRRWPFWARTASWFYADFRPFLDFIDSRKR